MNIGERTIQNITVILQENQTLLTKISSEELQLLIQSIQQAKRIFFMGTGRSGLALKMAAMRFMHIGFNVFVVGEITTPAIMEGDLLLLASGSGTTSTVIVAAKKAKDVHAKVFAMTTDEKSPLSILADHSLIVPAAKKIDFSEEVSVQYAGSLFEQCLLFVLDGIFSTLWQQSGLTKSDIWPRHANLE